MINSVSNAWTPVGITMIFGAALLGFQVAAVTPNIMSSNRAYYQRRTFQSSPYNELVRISHKPHHKPLALGNRFTIIYLKPIMICSWTGLTAPQHLDKIPVLLTRKECRNGWDVSNQVPTTSCLTQCAFS